MRAFFARFRFRFFRFSLFVFRFFKHAAGAWRREPRRGQVARSAAAVRMFSFCPSFPTVHRALTHHILSELYTVLVSFPLVKGYIMNYETCRDRLRYIGKKHCADCIRISDVQSIPLSDEFFCSGCHECPVGFRYSYPSWFRTGDPLQFVPRVTDFDVPHGFELL